MGSTSVAALHHSTHEELNLQLSSMTFPPLENLSVRKAIVLGLLLRFGMAAWSGFGSTNIVAMPDAAGFHLGAAAYAQGKGLEDFQFANIYIYCLGTIYGWTISSLFWGNLLSCGAWLGSAVLLLRTMQILSIREGQQIRAMLLFSLLPSSILMTSITLRESYQLFAVNLAMYSAINILVRNSFRDGFLLIPSLILMGGMHGALFVAGVFIIATVFSIYLLSNKKIHLGRFLLYFILIGMLVFLGYPYFLNAVFNTNDVGLFAALQARQDSWQQSARASYNIGIKIESLLDLIIFIPSALLNYLFQPMPWRISTFPDVALFLENLLRGWLIYKALSCLFSSSHEKKKMIGLIFISYLLIEVVWAVGTINWGTAVRHHVPAFGILLLAAYSGTTNKNNKLVNS
jgi:hypothetical protein